jgi:hypothetical protein
MRQRYDRAFKISVVAELESGKPLAQIARERSSHPPHVIADLESVSMDDILAGITQKLPVIPPLSALPGVLHEGHSDIIAFTPGSHSEKKRIGLNPIHYSHFSCVMVGYCPATLMSQFTGSVWLFFNGKP